MRASRHSVGNPDKPQGESGWRGTGRWGNALQQVLYSICLNLKLSTNLRVTVVGCVRARKQSYTTPDACQHARNVAWSICVPARTQLVIQISLREIVAGDEGDDEGAQYSMGDYTIRINLKLSSYLPVTLVECVMARILPTFRHMRASTNCHQVGSMRANTHTSTSALGTDSCIRKYTTISMHVLQHACSARIRGPS
jgi:hypothetical protein